MRKDRISSSDVISRQKYTLEYPREGVEEREGRKSEREERAREKKEREWKSEREENEWHVLSDEGKR